jgi:hypothetical protein
MGCGCIGPQTRDNYSIEDIISTKYSSTKKEITSTYPLTSYVKKVFYLINKIRTSPSEFITVIEQAEKYIKEINGRKIFVNSGLKIALNEGKIMFKDCMDYLKTLEPMNELIFCDEIVLECPTEENKIKDVNFFKEKLLEKKDKSGIIAYFKDSICIPEISVVLMLVDDSVKNPKKKREALLNPNFKYIGISASDCVNNEINEENNNDNGNVNKENNREKNIEIKNKDENNIDEEIKVEEKNGNIEGNNNANNEKENEINDNNNKNKEVNHKSFCAYFTLK